MILVESNANTSAYFRVWDTNTLMELPVDQDHPIELDTPPLISQAISYTWYPSSAICLSAHASPLQEGLYTIWVSVVLGGAIIIHKYFLSVVGPKRLSFHRTLSQPLVLWENFFRHDASISYAGHANVVSRIGYDRQVLPLAKWISDFPATKPPSNKWRMVSKICFSQQRFFLICFVEEKLEVGTSSHSIAPVLFECLCTNVGLQWSINCLQRQTDCHRVL
jgi:hypothetical protein